jgi:hypothetical protein
MVPRSGGGRRARPGRHAPARSAAWCRACRLPPAVHAAAARASSSSATSHGPCYGDEPSSPQHLGSTSPVGRVPRSLRLRRDARASRRVRRRLSPAVGRPRHPFSPRARRVPPETQPAAEAEIELRAIDGSLRNAARCHRGAAPDDYIFEERGEVRCSELLFRRERVVGCCGAYPILLVGLQASTLCMVCSTPARACGATSCRPRSSTRARSGAG